ncbi:MAG: FAD binding domain-containing protein [Hyphomonadaceae bacterium]|jgi:carbon-monoxide dehydrogenase medium subunit/xanthine dehydrogenase FAD-binding subunit|nr:FAD binding domain-containing protein [Hyphomonadaceae bacterium]
MLICDEYLTPTSLEEAFAAMACHRGECRIVAGATDLLPWAREGRAGDVEIPTLIDVSKIPELHERRADGKRVRLGAATPIQRFLDDPALAAALPAMPRCAVWFADDQIRESATIGGNIVNASPAGDGIPPLMAHDAVVELAARRNGSIVRRKVPLVQFITGPGTTTLAPDELLVAIECDALAGYGGSFEKVGHRRSLVISIVCLAVLVQLDGAGRGFEDVRLAIGGIGPVPRRLTAVESFLGQGAVTAARLEQAAAMPVELVASRTRQAYRRDIVRGFMLRGLIDAVRAAGGGTLTPDLARDLEAVYA